jgi:ferric-dicitrate binding protein FerR (iron transport regulator)
MGGRASQKAAPAASMTSILVAGDVAVIADTGSTVVHRSNVAALTAWTQGRFVFDETSLSEIVRELTRAFDLEFTVADTSLLSSTVTASFAGETDDQILTVVTQAIGAHYERRGRHVVIRRGAAAAGQHTQSPLLNARAGQVLSQRDALTRP